MATYPSGVYAPVSKSAGQTIQASFFNDPEAEITAVEDALRNGITHAVSIAGALTVSTGGLTVSTGSVNLGGPSSLATLQVNGGSTLTTLHVTSSATLAGGVTLSGGSTFSGPATFSTTVTFAYPPNNIVPSVSVGMAANLNLSSLAEVSPDWLTETWDNVGAHSTAVNSSRITFVDSTGLYDVGFSGCFGTANGVSPIVRARIRVNDTSAGPMATASAPSTASLIGLTCAGRIRVTSTSDYATVRLAFTTSSGATLLAASTTGLTSFWYTKASA